MGSKFQQWREADPTKETLLLVQESEGKKMKMEGPDSWLSKAIILVRDSPNSI